MSYEETAHPCGCIRDEVIFPFNLYAGIAKSKLTGSSLWESDWFSISVNGNYSFQHDLNLTAPWRCAPRLVARIKKAVNGWEPGTIIFADGSNYVGQTPNYEIGWVISLSATNIEVSFGNDNYFIGNARQGGMKGLNKQDVECKLVVSY